MTVISGNDHAAPASPLAQQLHWQLFRIMSTMRRNEYDRTSGGSLTLTQCSLLNLLTDRGRIRMTDLATAAQVAPPTMTRAVRRLADIGMCRRFRDPADHRIVWVEITSKGLDAQRDAIADMDEAISAALTPAEIDALHTALLPLERLAVDTGTRSSFEFGAPY